MSLCNTNWSLVVLERDHGPDFMDGHLSGYKFVRMTIAMDMLWIYERKLSAMFKVKLQCEIEALLITDVSTQGKIVLKHLPMLIQSSFPSVLLQNT